MVVKFWLTDGEETGHKSMVVMVPMLSGFALTKRGEGGVKLLWNVDVLYGLCWGRGV